MITFLTWATPDYRSNCLAVCRESLRQYAKTHDVRIAEPSEPEAVRHPSWRRLPLLAMQLGHQASSWVIWLDADGVILPDATDVELWLNSLPAWVNCVTAHDWNGQCNCFLALRVCTWSRDFIAAMRFIGTFSDVANTAHEHEQGLMKSFFMRAPEHQHRLLLAPSTICSDITLSSDGCQFYYHVGAGDTANIQRALLAGAIVGGMPHGVLYADH